MKAAQAEQLPRALNGAAVALPVRSAEKSEHRHVLLAVVGGFLLFGLVAVLLTLLIVRGSVPARTPSTEQKADDNTLSLLTPG